MQLDYMATAINASLEGWRAARKAAGTMPTSGGKKLWVRDDIHHHQSSGRSQEKDQCA